MFSIVERTSRTKHLGEKDKKWCFCTKDTCAHWYKHYVLKLTVNVWLTSRQWGFEQHLESVHTHTLGLWWLFPASRAVVKNHCWSTSEVLTIMWHINLPKCTVTAVLNHYCGEIYRINSERTVACQPQGRSALRGWGGLLQRSRSLAVCPHWWLESEPERQSLSEPQQLIHTH